MSWPHEPAPRWRPLSRFSPRSVRIPILQDRERRTIPTAAGHARAFAGGLLAVVLVGAFLLALPFASRDGQATPPVDALFTAVSAACVTGLVVVDTRDHWNWFGQVVILVLMQLGGLGFMVGASILLRMLQRSAPRLRHSLVLRDGQPTLSVREAGELTGRIIRFTLLAELVGAVILAARFADEMPIGRALWFGVFHSVSAFTNGSFDLTGGYRSLTGYQPSVVVNLTIMLLIQAGALSYVVLADAAGVRSIRRWALETKLVLLLNAALLVGGTAVFLSTEWSRTLDGTALWTRPMTALFHSVAARTAGFTTVDMSRASDATLFVWTGIMYVGGASGSTAGGAKLTTVGIVLLAAAASLKGEAEPQLFGRRVPSATVYRALAVMALMFAAHFIATLALAIAVRISGSDIRFIALLFEAMSALVTCGMSTGITPSLSTAAKLVLILTMLFGRLGPLTAAFALQRRHRPSRYRYPEELVRIG